MARKRASQESTRLRQAHAAAAAVERYKKALSRARSRLGDLTLPGDPDVFLGEEWRWADALHTRYAARLKRAHGVVGVGLGVRRKGGVVTSEPCIVVYVRKKLPREKLKQRGLRPVPSSLTIQGRKVPVDIVESGRLQLQSSMGDCVGPTGRPSSRGTLGAYAVDRLTSQPVAITALHVAGNEVKGVPPGGISIYDYDGGEELGTAVAGSRQGVDAMKIVLGNGARRVPLPGFEPLRGWRPVQFPADARISVWLFGAVSKSQGGILLDMKADVHGIQDALVADIYTQAGDSGAALIDNNRFLLGFLVGMDPASGNRIFCPAGNVLRALGCDLT